MKKWLFIFLLFQSGCRESFIQEKFQLQKGDFLFQDLDSSPLCEAIELVTSGYKNANLMLNMKSIYEFLRQYRIKLQQQGLIVS